jgi:RNA polymerase primary sigma factor
VSVDAPLVDGEDSTLIDVLSNPESPKADSGLMDESLSMEIARVLKSLPEREREIIRMCFGIGMSHEMTLEEIALKFDLTRERVRQIKEKALRMLRQSSRNKILKQYVG